MILVTGMTANSLSISQEYPHCITSNSRQVNVQIAQEEVYSFFIRVVNTMSPDEVLCEFKAFFIDGLDLEYSHSVPEIYKIF
ncbi:hypothetical protein NIES4072_57780 [Nostoc commune NIES-4072]|uniref:Uncharacterized protein n=1 Tax=Nostoc commune NIES-4072 TaxID=2005467 RepID=A0A2R5FTI9_NOSCO|nr:hypothetical protein NIES4070_33150 [Nostoc commune HK-02]GBG22072.1 hypothetical protein NIES4072_57780 [Nostoc commune NIES-4072]